MDFASLQHSIFLQALGSAILNSLWQSFIFWFLYETICISYKNASARLKNNVSTIFLFLSFIWFLTTFVLKIIQYRANTSENISTAVVGVHPSAASISSVEKLLSYAGSSLPYLSVAYIFLLCFLMAKLFTAYRYVYIISNKRLVPPPPGLQRFASEVASRMSITGKITVWISHHIDVPATIGFIKPIILIPFASLTNLSGEQLEAIILHELSHIKRNDYLINIVMSVIETILFFNPFIVLLSNVIKRERENCCDDFVLQYRYDPHSYASALLRLEQSRIHTMKLAIGAVSGKKQLLSRIKRITNGPVSSRQLNYGQRLLALLLVTGIICSIAWLSPVQKKEMSPGTLAKEENILTLPKTALPTKTEVIVAGEMEGLKNKILKHILNKKDPLLTANEESPTFPLSNWGGMNDTAGFSTDVQRFDFPAMKMNESHVFFDGTKLHLPRSVNVKNFPFRQMSFNIDLSKIDVDKLNENLQKAFKEINAIDWNKVQDNIHERFDKENSGNFLSKKALELYLENVTEDFPGYIDQEQLQTLTRLERENFRGKLRLQDSLTARQIELINKDNDKIQADLKKVKRLYSEVPRVNTYMNYTIHSADNYHTEENSVYINKTRRAPTHMPKAFAIRVGHAPSGDTIQGEKKVFQFSYDADTKKPGSANIINIEMTNQP